MPPAQRAALALVALALAASAARAHDWPPPNRTEVAPGVHLFQSVPYGDVGLDGNSVAIVTDSGVVVFDANGTPAAARAVLAQIEQLTAQPVRFLVLSHWHWDHWYGAEVYAERFPGLEIIAHARTRALMDGPVQAFNRPGLESDLPAHLSQVEGALARARAQGADTTRLAAHAALDRAFLAQKRSVRPTLPTITFHDSLDLHLGGRLVQVRHLGAAITPGDAFLVLPQQGVVLTGDLLIHPLTFALFCHPSGWIRSLEWLDRLDAPLLVPGHGAAQRGDRLLHDTLALLRRQQRLALAARAAGRTAAEARSEVLLDPEILRLRDRLTSGEPSLHEDFGLYMVEWFVDRVFDEAAGKLGEGIPGVP